MIRSRFKNVLEMLNAGRVAAAAGGPFQRRGHWHPRGRP